MICKEDFSELKTNISDNIGNKILVRGTSGRTKNFEREATIEKAYTNIFIVKFDGANSNVTYSYTDVLTNTIELKVYNGDGYSPIIPQFKAERFLKKFP